MNPEKNDVNISKLFAWGDKFEIYNKYNNETVIVYIRLIGDAELNQARVYGLHKSSSLRKKLKDTTSFEYDAFIAGIYELDDKDKLVDLLCTLSMRNVVRNAYREIKTPAPVEPKSDASLEAQERYQAEVDSWDERHTQAINEFVQKQLDIIRTESSARDVAYLQGTCAGLYMDDLCEKEMMDAYKTFCVYSGTFSDEQYTTRLFTSVGEFENLPADVKIQFISHYDDLDMGIEQLKKLQEATL